MLSFQKKTEYVRMYTENISQYFFSDCQEKLNCARSHAAPYEKAMKQLFPWVPDTLTQLDGLGPAITEHRAVEVQVSVVQKSSSL